MFSGRFPQQQEARQCFEQNNIKEFHRSLCESKPEDDGLCLLRNMAQEKHSTDIQNGVDVDAPNVPVRRSERTRKKKIEIF